MCDLNETICLPYKIICIIEIIHCSIFICWKLNKRLVGASPSSRTMILNLQHDLQWSGMSNPFSFWALLMSSKGKML